jgi:hypothetical protein
MDYGVKGLQRVFRSVKSTIDIEERKLTMPKPTIPAGLLLQSIGLLLLVGAVMLANWEPPAFGLAAVSGIAGVVFFILGAKASR